MHRVTTIATMCLLITGCGSETQEPAPAAAVAPGTVAFTGATIWDGSGSAAQPGATMLVRDGRIVGIVDSRAALPSGTEIVDLAGAWVVPGFINAHGHASGRWADEGVEDIAARVEGDLALYAHYGVTTVLSLGGAPTESFAIRGDQDSASLDRARLLLAGEVVFSQDPAEAAAMTKANIDAGVDWIKLRVDDNLGSIEKMSRDALAAAVNAAEAADIPVATHIFYMDDAAMMLELGTNLIAHSVRDRQVTDDFIQTLLDSGVCYVPTLVREVSTFVYGERPAFFDDPLFLEAAKQSEIDRLSDPEFMQRMAESPTAPVYRQALKQAQENLRILVEAGVPIAFGTDSGPPGRFPGFFEHMEFDLMSESGLTPEQILFSATSVAAQCLELDDVGTLQPGNWADFVVLSDNPLASVDALHAVRDVYVAGNSLRK
ncbi:MAG: amidohydrolase family protein [Woeseiaceae bacterium]|nr:amidohydrolase family protein [Woeseiaceae bacterium]